MSGIQIHAKDAIPFVEGFVEMPHLAIDAYSDQHGMHPGGFFADEARNMAIRTVSSHFEIPEQEVLSQFNICIIPGVGFHGKIIARRV